MADRRSFLRNLIAAPIALAAGLNASALEVDEIPSGSFLLVQSKLRLPATTISAIATALAPICLRLAKKNIDVIFCPDPDLEFKLLSGKPVIRSKVDDLDVIVLDDYPRHR